MCNNANEEYWFVLRVTYQRELAAKERLDKLGVQNFVPTQLVRRKGASGRFFWIREAALHNYIFIHTEKTTLQTIKQNTIPWLRYIMQTSPDGIDSPQVVPDEQMNNFIAVAGNENERVMFLDPNEIDLSKGDKVRILAGPFAGVEGVFMKIQNRHEKRVVIKIDGVTAVATASLPCVQVEKIV